MPDQQPAVYTENNKTTSGEPPVTPAKKNRPQWVNSNLLGFFAFIISIGSFVTFAYQTYLIRNQTAMIQKQQYASVLPYLTIYKSLQSGNGQQPYDYALIVQNNGVGPAFITDLRVSYQGKDYEGDVKNFIMEEVYHKNQIKTSSHSLFKGSVIPAGEGVRMIMSQDTLAARVLMNLFEGDSASLKITYNSVFEETWTVNSAEAIPVKDMRDE